VPTVQVLPDSLVNQIAAGEVIERPASVVKELVENSLDAGARRVTVDVEGGGVARIDVGDDGGGMGPEDARLALERHATSKIRSFEDLTRIGTLGFRGEALPSIASVSRLTLTTSPDDSGLGTEVLAERGAPPRTAPARHPKGTRILVENLFGNVPARKKFLKSPEAELRAIVRALTAQALGRPDVAFTLRAGPRTLVDLPAALDGAARFHDVVGRSVVKALVPVSFSFGGMTLTGAVTPPEVTFASRTNQWFFVNGRAAKDSTVAHAAALAARDVLRDDRFPAFALFLSCDPLLCDVNVHPQKLEVRFRDPSTVHSIVHRGLALALTGGKGAVPVSGGRLVAVPAGPGGWGSGALAGGAVSAIAEAIGA
jgi:DNA mismatch repair protein MutL